MTDFPETEVIGREGFPDPDTSPYTRWSYADMQQEMAALAEKVCAIGIDKQLAAIYALKLLDLGNDCGYDKRRFSETFMAKTAYFAYVLARDIKLPPYPGARELFDDYAALAETWGDRHYRGLELTQADTERLRTDSYAVLSGLTKRAIEEESWRPAPPPRISSPLEAMKLVEFLNAEGERIRTRYYIIPEAALPAG